MELVSLGMEMLQNIAEQAASYRLGQSVLRQLDRTLWVVEKCARWAVPPPLDQDERPQPELVRPLPWVFFLMMLITLRVIRESISLANLIMGKPPLRSADLVMFIQSKRRYLRTLKYQGNRMMRARTSSQAQQPWYNKLQSLFELTMCFRRQSQNYGNNNTTPVTNNDEVMVIKRNESGDQDEVPIVPSTETTMERLIEKMMLDLDAESDEDSDYTLTNNSPKSDRSELTESDQDTVCHQTSPPTKTRDTEISQTNGDDIHFSPNKDENSSSTPERTENHEEENNLTDQTFQISQSDNTQYDKTITENSYPNNEDEKRRLDENVKETGNSVNDNSNSVYSDGPQTKDATLSEKNLVPTKKGTENFNKNEAVSYNKTYEDKAFPPLEETTLSQKQETENIIKSEASSYNSQRAPKKDQKIVNGRAVKSLPSKKKGNNPRERRGESNEALRQKVLPSNSSF